MTEIMAAANVPPRLRDYEIERATFRIEVAERFNAVVAIGTRTKRPPPRPLADRPPTTTTRRHEMFGSRRVARRTGRRTARRVARRRR